MALDSDTLKRWADGKPSKDASIEKDDDDSPEDHDGEDDRDDEEDEDESGDRETLWAGEEKGDLEQVVTPERADELLSWLQENEPEIHEEIVELAEAVSEDDQEKIDEEMEELLWVTQKLNPEYPELTEEQRKQAGDNIATHIREAGHPKKDSPEWKQAVAIGLAEARRGKEHEGGDGDDGGKKQQPFGKKQQESNDGGQ